MPGPLKKPNDELQNASAAKAKADAIIDNLTRLATAYNEPLTPERIEVYTIALINLSADELTHGFNRALRETKWWPKPAELIEFCTGRTSSMADKLTIDEAWQWAVRYIELFGIPAQTRWELQGNVLHGATLDAAMRSSSSKPTFAVSADFYELMKYEVPAIPELLRETLVAMAGSIRMGLTRLKEAMTGWNGAEMEKVSSKDAAFVRRDFDEYCSRVISATRVNAPTQINPALQLPGETAPAFPPFTRKGVAVKVVPEHDSYKFFAMPFEVAKDLFDRGELSKHLYEEAECRTRERLAREKACSTPVLFNAVYIGEWKPKWSSSTASWPKMGRFNVESHDGKSVVIADLPMAVGERQFKLGDLVQFKAALNELKFDEHRQEFFNLNPAIIDKEK